MLSDFGISPAASLRVTLPPFEGNKRKKAKELLSWSLPPSPPSPPPLPFIMKPHSNMRYFIRNLGPVDTYRIYMKTEIFFSVLAFCPPVNRVFRHPKPRFSKTSPRVELFSESPAYRLCEQTRTEVFEYNDVIHHTAHALLMMLSYFFV